MIGARLGPYEVTVALGAGEPSPSTGPIAGRTGNLGVK